MSFGTAKLPDDQNSAAADGGQSRNPPGQQSLSLRLAGRRSLLAGMLARLPQAEVLDDSGVPRHPLASLKSLPEGDPTRALLDAAATVGDILSFYQERIANEGFLRTARERRSVLELGRTLGYELPQGVAANTYLAFTIDPQPGHSLIPAGTAVRSLASSTSPPQVFETSADLWAHAGWNELRPQLSTPQLWDSSQRLIYLDGSAPTVRPGGSLLFVWRKPDGSVQTCQAVRVRAVQLESAAERTRVELDEPLSPPESPPQAVVPPGTLSDPSLRPLTSSQVSSEILEVRWSEAELQALLRVRGWDASGLLACVARLRAQPLLQLEVYVLRQRLGCFGYNAPSRLADEQPTPDLVKSVQGPAGSLTLDQQTELGQRRNVWRARDPNSRSVWTDHDGGDWPDSTSLFLERPVSDVSAGGFAVLYCGSQRAIYQLARVRDSALAQYGLTGSATGLRMTRLDSGDPRPTGFALRGTFVELQSERVALLPQPLDQELASYGGKEGVSQIQLDTMVLGLVPGQLLWVSGEPLAAPGLIEHELVKLADVEHSGGFSTLRLGDNLGRGYLRQSVRICANVVPATRGEAAPEEILGSGDATLAFQSFPIKRRGLVFTQSPAQPQPLSSLQIIVGGIPWRQVQSLHEAGAGDPVFIVRVDDDGYATVIFGDGTHGARLPSGQDNVVARYRTADGVDEPLPAFSLTLLDNRPMGVRAVHNPLPTFGAVAREALEEGRNNVPVRARTLDRAVSVPDYQDFALAIGGVGKATARALWADGVFSVHVTVAPSDGIVLDSDAPLLQQVSAALATVADPLVPVRVQGFRQTLFTVSARVILAAGADSAKVLVAARTALQDAYSFARRDFNQPVTVADILSILQGVSGVVAAQVRSLVRTGEDPRGPGAAILTSAVAQVDPASSVITPAELLVLQPRGVLLEEVRG